MGFNGEKGGGGDLNLSLIVKGRVPAVSSSHHAFRHKILVLPWPYLECGI